MRDIQIIVVKTEIGKRPLLQIVVSNVIRLEKRVNNYESGIAFAQEKYIPALADLDIDNKPIPANIQ